MNADEPKVELDELLLEERLLLEKLATLDRKIVDQCNSVRAALGELGRSMSRFSTPPVPPEG